MINVSEKYYPLFNPPDGVDIFVITGGRFSQKSFAVSLAAILWCVNYNHRVLFSRFTNVSAKDSIVPELEEKITMLNYDNYFDVSNGRVESKFNNSKIVFKGLKAGSGNQTANLKGLKDFSAWVLDETEELTDYDIAEKTMLSIRGNTKENQFPNLKVFILNPTKKTHWIYKEYFQGKNVKEGFNGVKGNVCYIHTSYLDCLEFVPDEILIYFDRLKKTNIQRYNNIVLGGWLDEVEGALWKHALLDLNRVDKVPQLKRILVALDPSTTDTKDSDECGIIVGGLGYDNHVYVFKDLSGIYSPLNWANVAINAYEDYKADRVVAESNQGGDMIKTIIHQINNRVAYKKVHASRGKKARAEPVQALYEQGEVHHVGVLNELENEMTTWRAMEGEKSPNRIDALVWLVTELRLQKQQGILGYNTALKRKR